MFCTNTIWDDKTNVLGWIHQKWIGESRTADYMIVLTISKLYCKGNDAIYISISV